MFSGTYRSISVLLLFITVNHWVLGSLHLIASVFVTSSLYAAVPLLSSLSLPLTVEQFQWPNRLQMQMQMIHKYASGETDYGWKMYQLISTKGKVRSSRFLSALGPCSALRSQ